MAKERKPIATRTRNRTKSQDGNRVKMAKVKQDHKHQDGKENKDLQYKLPYLPKSNLDMYLKELDQLPLSFVRGTTAEKRRDILRNGQDQCYDMSHFTVDNDDSDNIKGQLSSLLNDNKAPDVKNYTEYSTCLHRAFIKKRYLSDQECMHLAKYVNCDFYTQSLQELAMLIKDEFYMYRIDFTQRHLNHIRTMNITEEDFLKNEKGLEKVLEQQVKQTFCICHKN
ncbi:hypothetical protein BD408DRAFT_11734 [Parasitella parasitica]|nr:hypothetical protein BD408DRAFT_11734 [Parasitella parasitica]